MDATQVYTLFGGIFTLVGVIFTGYIGFRGKGKDSAVAREAAIYDNLQEDLVNCRAQLIAEHNRADFERKRANDEQARADGLHDLWIAERQLKHDQNSILRTAFTRMKEADVHCDDLIKRQGDLSK